MSPVNFFLVLSAFLFSTVAPMQVSTDEMTASCDCPATGECGTCSGGLTKLTLQYIGTVAALVELEDAGGEVFSGTVNPGEVFMAVGTSGPGKFQGSNIEILIDGVHHEDIPVTCHSSVVPHATFGDFRIVAGESQNGGPLCCPPGSEEDNILPTISNCPSNIEVDADASGCSKSVTWTAPSASDNCTLQPFTPSHAPGSTFPVGTTTVTYTATDDSGNTATCQFDVVVKDVIAPVISQCPENITVTADESGSAAATWSVPTFSDNCAGAVLDASHNPGDLFTTGVTTVTYTASDLSGNSSVCTFTVTVQASVPPDQPDPTDPDPDPTDPDPEPTDPDNEPDPTDPVLTEPGATEPGTDPNPTQPGTTEPDTPFLLEISKIITPDGNGINDVWMLLNIEEYGNNEVLVVDRWGNEIFRAAGYDNENVVWSGRSTEGKVLPAGTYFYVIRIQAESATIERKGFVELVN